MSDKEQRYTIVFNGEIYNYLDLKERLELVGHHFSTESDTEVLPFVPVTAIIFFGLFL